MLLAGVLLQLVLVSFVGLPALLIACFVKRWRQVMLRHPRTFSALGLVFSTVVVRTLWSEVREVLDAQALNPRLEQDLQLGGLRFPAGTQVQLATWKPLDIYDQPHVHGLQSLKYAEFAEPQSIMGVQVTALELPESGDYARVQLASDQVVDGWPCAGGSWVTLDAAADVRLQPGRWTLDSCTLATQAVVQGVSWPVGSLVSHHTHEYIVQTLGAAHPPVVVEGIGLASLTLKLNEQRQRWRWEGQLADTMTLGDWEYPRGMSVRQDEVQTLLFSPSSDYAARNLRTGETLAAGHSILQRRADGSTLWIKPNAELGVPDW